MPEKILITTIASGQYQWYAPLFVYQAKRAYPEYDVVPVICGDILVPKSLLIWNNGYYKHIEFREELGPLTTAAYRYIPEYDFAGNYDYTFITDIDIIIFKEDPPIHEQHLNAMRKKGLPCYDSYIYATERSRPLMNPSLFVTRDWWQATKEARAKYGKILLDSGAPYPKYDEEMIGRIIEESGLPLPDKKHQSLWSGHGLHLGAFRNKIGQMYKPSISAHESQLIRDMVDDPEFMRIVKECGEGYPIIKRLFNYLRGYVG